MAAPNSQPPAKMAPSDTLSALLGVKGPLRLLPQGPAPKPHIVLKRDYSRDGAGGTGNTIGAVRFSFIAGKKFTVNKGQPLLFTIAPTAADPSEKTLGGGNTTTYLLEGDLFFAASAGEVETPTPLGVESAGAETRASFEDRLPPKMRKSHTHKQTYAGFAMNEAKPTAAAVAAATPAHGPANTPAPRVLVDTEVQTDNTSNAIPRDITPIPQTLSCIVPNPTESPTQLPSPVSADHTRDIITDALIQFEPDDVYEYARSDRSLSPMDLDSENCTPASFIVQLPTIAPFDSEGLLFRHSPGTNAPTPPSIPLVGGTADSAAESPASRLNAPIAFGVLPQPLSEDLASAPVSKEGSTMENPIVEEQFLIAEDAEISKTLSDTVIGDSATGETLPALCAPTPRAAPQIERGDAHDSSSHKQPIKAFEDASTYMKETDMKISKRATPVFIKSARSSLPKTWECDDGWATIRANPTPYIPTPTIGNPLGIRPSSSHPPPPKPIPTGPRALLVGRGHAIPSQVKKPVVVGVKWSAARNSGSSANVSNGGVSASASSSSSLSSSLSSIPTSPTPAPKLLPKANLSDVLRYTSPSPPPAESKPPSPPRSRPDVDMDAVRVVQYHPSPDWSPAPGPIALPDSSSSAMPTHAPTPAMSDMVICAAPTPAKSLTACTSPVPSSHYATPPPLIDPNPTRKRAYKDWEDDSSQSTEHSKRRKVNASASPRSSPHTGPTPEVSISVPSMSADRMSSEPLPITPISSVLSHNISSHGKPQLTQESGSWSTKVIVPMPQSLALKHPLPPRPVATGSSYRPAQANPRRKKSRGSGARRTTDWPSTTPTAEHRFHGATATGGTLASVQKIMFSNDGALVAFICGDRTLRIWENKPPGEAYEVARLPHVAHIASACWLDGPAAVMTLCADGQLCTWTRSLGGDWKFAVLIKVPELSGSSAPICMTYHKDRIAVSVMSVVKVWLLISGKWQPQREIARSGVTALKFVQGGDALIGGCRDGVLWYCEIPNGTLRVHAFLSQKPIISIDTHPTGTYLLVAQEGGKAHLVTMRSNQNKGNIERTYTSEKIQAMSPTGFPAVFATSGQAVLYGMMNGCALVWDRKKCSIVYGLKHPEGDPVETAATFDGRPGAEGWIITGTKQGRVFWWPGPVAAAPSHSTGGGETHEP